MAKWLSDRQLGIRTARKERAARLDLPPEVAAEAHDYEPSPYGVLLDALLSIPIEPWKTTFVDVGCGRGRVLAEAAHHGFRRIVGLEASARLASEAVDNLRSMGVDERADIRCVDATAHPLPPEALLVYLFNPFGRAAHDRFAARVEERVRCSPEDLWVVHHQPEHRGAWSKAPSLRCVEQGALRIILRRAPRRAVSHRRDRSGS